MLATYNEIAAQSFGDLIEIVRQGYKTAAHPYHEQKDASSLSLPIYHHWLGLVPEGIVAELGCGSGYPLAHHIASLWKGTNKKYVGIDLSEEQIEIAKQSLVNETETVNFTVREMMDWCKKQKDNSLSGIVALFAVFHLPRSQHVELFSQMHRILKDNAPVLFTCPEKAIEGFEDRWLGNSRMYWSSFSAQWYEVTLDDIGFEFVSKSKETKNLVGQKETTYYLLYTRRPRRKQVSREMFYQQLSNQNSNHMQNLQQQNMFLNQQQPQTPSSIPNTPMSPQAFMPLNASGDMSIFEMTGMNMNSSLGNLPLPSFNNSFNNLQ